MALGGGGRGIHKNAKNEHRLLQQNNCFFTPKLTPNTFRARKNQHFRLFYSNFVAGKKRPQTLS